MPDQDIFDNKEPKPGETPPNPPQNPWEDKLKGILNENGEPKYKTVEDALTALEHSQQFISTLKSEKTEVESKLQEAQAELEKVGSVKDVVQDLFNDRPDPDTKVDQPSSGGLDENKVREMLTNLLQQNKQQETRESNLNSVVAKLTEQHGDKAKEVIAEAASKYNTTPEKLRELASENPNMALSLLGSVEVKNPQQPSSSSVTPPHNPPKNGELDKPEKSLLRGATNAEITDYWKKVKDHTYNRLNVEI